MTTSFTVNTNDDNDNTPRQRHRRPPPPPSPRWTDTNSDERCLADDHHHHPINRFLYILSLKTGFYSIEPMDRRFSLLIVCFLMLVSTVMLYVFGRGVRDGFQQRAAETMTITTTAAA